MRCFSEAIDLQGFPDWLSGELPMADGVVTEDHRAGRRFILRARLHAG
jgi:hypothetical protein